MSKWVSTLGQTVNGLPLPPTADDLADWANRRWWWADVDPLNVAGYDQAAGQPQKRSTRRPTLTRQ